MKKQYIIVEHRQSALTARLQRENADLRSALRLSELRYKDVETKYCNEVFFNSELIDILNLHDISFRKCLSNKNRGVL